MIRLLLALALTACLSLPGRADDQAIRGVISAQIDAFLSDDVDTAFTFASPTIKQIFGSPERFGQMVRQGYPMVWRPDSVRFFATEDRGGRLFQTVMIRDRAGALHLLEYEMVTGQDGWKINGVRLLAPSDGTA